MINLLKRMGGFMSVAALSCMALAAHGQSIDQYILASGGGAAPLTGGNIMAFTVGEVVITTAGANPILTQGFNQPTISGAPLPVAMNFSGTAEAGYNKLDWITYQESGNDYFELQRSADGTNYNAIAKIPSKAPRGTSTSKLQYTYPDYAFVSGRNYYRIRQVDINGRQTYTSVVTLENLRSAASLSVSPNPAMDKIQVLVPEAGIISIVDINGKTVQQADVTSVTTIDISALQAGAYFIRYQGTAASGSLRFVKK